MKTILFKNGDLALVKWVKGDHEEFVVVRLLTKDLDKSEGDEVNEWAYGSYHYDFNSGLQAFMKKCLI